MDQNLQSGPIGSVGSYNVAFKDGKLVASANLSLPPGESMDATIKIDAGKVLDALAAAVPGKLDDLLIGLIKTALGV